MTLSDRVYDFNLAITAWKTLFLERHNKQDRLNLVWQPTQNLLDKLASQGVLSLTCFAGKYYMFPANSNGVAVNVFFFGTESKAAYLGTLLDPTAYALDKVSEVKRLSKFNPILAQMLQVTGPRTIVRDAHCCKIPVSSEIMDTDTATEAVHQYLAINAPHLAKNAVIWLPHEQGIDFEQNNIRFEAKRTAKKPTKEDRSRTITQDDAMDQDDLELWGY